MKDVTCIVVTRNCAQLLPTLLDRLPAHAPLTIADNASTDDTLKRVEAAGRAAKILQLGSNQGFARSANRALEEVSTPFALVLMPCAWLAQGAADILRRAALSNPETAVFVPRLIDEFGAPLTADPGPPALPPGDPDGQHVETARNVALFVRVSEMKQLGGFDTAFRHFAEAEDLCRRASTAGAPARAVPEAEVFCPTTGVPGSRPVGRQFAHAEWSQAHLISKHARGENPRRDLERRRDFLERRAMWYSLIGPPAKSSEFRWRAFGLGAFLAGKSSDELQSDLDNTQR